MHRQRISTLLPALFLLLVFTLSGCGSSGPVGPNAEQVGEQFYAALIKGDFAAAADEAYDAAGRHVGDHNQPVQ